MIFCIIQARMGSQRLPGKVLMRIKGIPLLTIMVDRVKRSKLIDKLVIATTDKESDQIIVDYCVKNDIPCFRGSEEDVLNRYYWATMIGEKKFKINIDHIVRLTADCPMIDYHIIDETINHHCLGKYDYTNNPCFPDGLDVEIMTKDCLQKCFFMAEEPGDREHVTTYIKSHPEIFKIGEYRNPIDLSNVKLSVDTMDDFLRVAMLIELFSKSTMEIFRQNEV